MAALLVGLLIVALGAGGTWIALFGRNPASNYASDDTRLIDDSGVAEPVRRDQRVRRRVPAGRPAMVHLPKEARTSPARRVASALLLIVVMAGIALSIGAIASAVIVVIVTVVS